MNKVYDSKSIENKTSNKMSDKSDMISSKGGKTSEKSDKTSDKSNKTSDKISGKNKSDSEPHKPCTCARCTVASIAHAKPLVSLVC